MTSSPPVEPVTQIAIPFLKWAGGKHSLLGQFKPLFPKKAQTYYEPFLGGGAVFFYLRSLNFADRYILSDINPELINVYTLVRDDLGALLNKLSEHKKNHDPEDNRYYNRVRAMDRLDGGLDQFSSVERAARMLYLNRTCFNGLWRVNSKGQFNVPMGRYTNPAIINEKRLRAASVALQGVEIVLRSFEAVGGDAKRGDFVYFDPPYVPLNPSSNFTSYAAEGFGTEEQQALADLYRELDATDCSVMLSNSYTETVRDLYKGFSIKTVKAKRRINSKSSDRGEVKEALVLNYKSKPK